MHFRSAIKTCILLFILLLSHVHANAAVIARWKFEGPVGTSASGTDSIIDEVGLSHGTPSGGPIYESAVTTGGLSGLRFDGTNDMVGVSDHPRFELTQSLTVEAIVKLYSVNPSGLNWNHFIYRGDDRGGLDAYWLGLRPSDGRLHFSFDPPSGSRVTVTSPAPAPLDQYFHVAGTLNHATGKVTLWLNGQEVGSTTTSLRPIGALSPTNNPGLGLGGFQLGSIWASSGRLNGTLADARISDVALTPAQFLPEPSAALLVMGLGSVLMLRRQPRAM